MKEKGNKRRSFLKNTALLTWALPATMAGDNFSVFGQEKKAAIDQSSEQPISGFTLLITSDIHAQIHTHDEFFGKMGRQFIKKEEDWQY